VSRFNGFDLLLGLVLLGLVCSLWAGALREHRDLRRPSLDRLADPTPLPDDRWPADAGKTTAGEVALLGIAFVIFLGVVQAIASSKP